MRTNCQYSHSYSYSYSYVQVDTYELFKRFDMNHNGRLEAKELAMMFHTAIPTLTPQQLRYVMAHMISEVGAGQLGGNVGQGRVLAG